MSSTYRGPLSSMLPGAALRGRLAPAVLVAGVFAINFLLLARFWFNAPIMDDYDCILLSMDAMARSASLGEWLGHVFALQNEHRLAGTRLIPQVLAWVTGGIDFRLLMLFGLLSMFGAFAFMWAEFRDSATGPVAAAAALMVMQWSYNEALLMASAATAHLGVVLFSIGALYFALRPGAASGALCVAGGILAAYSQANGLFVLPIAALGCLGMRRYRRAALFLVVAAIVWALYFKGYARPHNHPSILKALEDPVKTLQLFLVIVGGAVPSLALSQLYGAAIVAGLGWVTWKGLWRRHPTAFLGIAFVVVSAGTVAAARVGFGLHHGSRYSVYAALMLGLLVFAIHSLTQPWRRGLDVALLAAAAVAWVAITIVVAGEIRHHGFQGRLLAAVDSKIDLGLPRYVGVLHPNKEHGARILDSTIAHGWYRPPRYAVDKSAVTLAATRPAAGNAIGVMDEVVVDGPNVVLRGWTHVNAAVPNRTFTLHPAQGIAGAQVDRLYARDDVAIALQRPDWVLSGFRIVAEYASEEEARKAAPALCVFVTAPGHGTSQILRTGVTCG